MEYTILDADCGNIIAVYRGKKEADLFLHINGLCPFATFSADTITAFATRVENIDPRFDCVDIDSLIFTPGLIERG